MEGRIQAQHLLANLNVVFAQGFDGRTFDFLGAKDQVFNIITHTDHQLNAAFIDADFPHYVNGTFIGAVGILHRSHQVQAHVLSDGRLDVTADGVALTPDHTIGLGDASVDLDSFGTSLVFRSELCVWKIVGVAPYTWKDVFTKAHIDMQVSQACMWKQSVWLVLLALATPSCLRHISMMSSMWTGGY